MRRVIYSSVVKFKFKHSILLLFGCAIPVFLLFIILVFLFHFFPILAILYFCQNLNLAVRRRELLVIKEL